MVTLTHVWGWEQMPSVSPTVSGGGEGQLLCLRPRVT